MQFNSFEYLLFLPCVVLFCYLLPHRFRWVFLLAASYYFYAAWRVDFVGLLLISTVTDYIAGLHLERTERPLYRKMILSVSLAVNLGLLIFFKYIATIWEGVRWGAIHLFAQNAATLPHLDILLPLGISFYTFQTLSYTIDVYRRKIPAEHHLGYFALYVAFFPQLLAGPIERASALLTQLKTVKHFQWSWCGSAYLLIVLGLAKKTIIADWIGEVFAPVIRHPEAFSLPAIMLTPAATVYRYYCDLSGYADIAIGSALLLGIQLSKNFDRPFSATTTIRFWYRWHITVTGWFRDYLMRSFTHGGSITLARPGPLIITGLIIGLWHGPSIGWLVAGASVSLLALPEIAWTRWRLRHRIRPKSRFTRLIWQWFGRCYVLGVVFYLIGLPLTWGNADQLTIIWHKIIQSSPAQLVEGADGLPFSTLLLLTGTIIVLELWQWLDAHDYAKRLLVALPMEIRWFAGASLAIMTLIFANATQTGFLYFQY